MLLLRPCMLQNYHVDIGPGHQASQPNIQQLGQSHEQELLYDNDYIIRTMTDTDTPEPTGEYSYTAVTHSRQLKQKANSKMNNSNGIEMNSCVAYGTTA